LVCFVFFRRDIQVLGLICHCLLTHRCVGIGFGVVRKFGGGGDMVGKRKKDKDNSDDNNEVVASSPSTTTGTGTGRVRHARAAKDAATDAIEATSLVGAKQAKAKSKAKAKGKARGKANDHDDTDNDESNDKKIKLDGDGDTKRGGDSYKGSSGEKKDTSSPPTSTADEEQSSLFASKAPRTERKGARDRRDRERPPSPQRIHAVTLQTSPIHSSEGPASASLSRGVTTIRDVSSHVNGNRAMPPPLPLPSPKTTAAAGGVTASPRKGGLSSAALAVLGGSSPILKPSLTTSPKKPATPRAPVPTFSPSPKKPALSSMGPSTPPKIKRASIVSIVM
jgi:hypothetical protein